MTGADTCSLFCLCILNRLDRDLKRFQSDTGVADQGCPCPISKPFIYVLSGQRVLVRSRSNTRHSSKSLLLFLLTTAHTFLGYSILLQCQLPIRRGKPFFSALSCCALLGVAFAASEPNGLGYVRDPSCLTGFPQQQL